MLRSILIACALAALSTLTACPLPAGTSCSSTNDCRSDEICVEQRCRFACNSNVECRGSETCQGGVCLERSDAGASDGAGPDTAILDRGSVDRSTSDRGGRDVLPADQPALDHAGADQRANDTAPVDRASSDHLASDQTLADLATSDRTTTDQRVGDRAQPDVTAPDRTPVDACAPANPDWWNTAFAHRAPLIIGAAPGEYTLELELTGSAAAALTDRALTGNGSDVRVVWIGAMNAVEINRELIAYGPERVVLRFQLQTTQSYPGGSGAYYLYVGASLANSPAADLKKVYLFFEDFEQFALGSNASTLFHSYPNAGWQVVDSGSAHHVFNATGSGAHYSELIGATLIDGVIEARIALLVATGTPASAGLIFRATGMPNLGGDFYYGRLSLAGSTMGVCEVNNGNQIGCLATTPFVANADTWYPLEIRFRAADATATAEHSVSASASGLATVNQQLALMTYNSEALFDDVKVRKLVVPEPTVALGGWETRCR